MHREEWGQSPAMIEGEKGKIGYDQEFWEFLQNHPEQVATARDLALQLKERLVHILENVRLAAQNNNLGIDLAAPEYGEVVNGLKKDGVEVAPVQTPLSSWGFKVTIPSGESYFLKIINKENEKRGKAGAFREFKDTVEAEADLKDFLTKKDALIIQPKLGYSDEEIDYFVAPWITFPILQDYILFTCEDPTESERLERTSLEIITSLSEKGYDDVNQFNMFYDPEHKKIILFDIHKDPKKFLSKD